MNPPDLTLDELRLALAPGLAEAAAFDGWTGEAVASAAAGIGVDPAVAAIAFPGGAVDMIDAWFASIDACMIEALPAALLATLPMRERIRRLIAFRLECLVGREESLRRAQAILAMPRNAGRAMRLGWRSADRMWRLAGDTSADFNHYTKRTTLAGIYLATLLVFVADDSAGKADSHAFLARRIDGVMRFEKAKARLLKPAGEHFSLTRLLGRLRYPAR